MLAVATAARAFVTILSDEATLFQQLHTTPLPVTHVLVEPVLSGAKEYRWQNGR